MKFKQLIDEIKIMKTSQWILLCLLGLGIVILLMLLSDPPIASTGKVHEQFNTMAHSGSSVTASSQVKWLAYFFGMGIILIFGFAVSMGAKKYGRFGDIKKWLFIGVIAYLLVFTLLTFSYWNYTEDYQLNIFGGLPAPTALMLYGLGTIPIVLTIVYVTKFRNWILTEEEEKRFKEIVKRRNERTI